MQQDEKNWTSTHTLSKQIVTVTGVDRLASSESDPVRVLICATELTAGTQSKNMSWSEMMLKRDDAKDMVCRQEDGNVMLGDQTVRLVEQFFSQFPAVLDAIASQGVLKGQACDDAIAIHGLADDVVEGAIKWRDANVVVKRQTRRLNPLAAEFFISKPNGSATKTEMVNAADRSIPLTPFNPYSIKEFYHANRPIPLHADDIMYYGELGDFYMDEGNGKEMEVKKGRRRSKKRSKSKRKKNVPDLENDPNSYVSRLKFGGLGKLEKEQNTTATTAKNQKNAANSETIPAPIIQSAQSEIKEQTQMKGQEKLKRKPDDGIKQQSHSTRVGTKKTLWVDALKDGVKQITHSNAPISIQQARISDSILHTATTSSSSTKKGTHKGLIHSGNKDLSTDNERSQLTRNVKTNSGFMIGSLIAKEIERQLRSQKKKREKKRDPDAKIDYRKIPLPPKKRKQRTLIIPIGREGKRTVNIDLSRFTPGMYREMGRRKKKKRPSTLKKIILAEKKRDQQEQHEEMVVQKRKMKAENVGDDDTGWETVDEFEQDDILLGDMACVFSSESPARKDTKKGKIRNIQRSQSDHVNITDDSDVPLHSKDETFEEVSEDKDGIKMKPKREPPKRVVREYVDHLLNKKLDELVTQFIYKLRYYQAKIRIEHPLMFEMKRKFVIGLKQTIRSVKYGKAVAVIIAPNIESIKSEGGLDDLVYTLIEAARNKDVPIVYALKVKRLGHIFGKHQMSCMAIYRTDPAHAEFKSIMSMVAENRKLFREQNPHWEEEVYLNHPAVRKIHQQRDQSVKQKELDLKNQRDHDRAKHRKFLERAKREKTTKQTGSSSSSSSSASATLGDNSNNKAQQVSNVSEKNKLKQQQQEQKKQGKQTRQHENPDRSKQNPASERSSTASRRTSSGNPKRGKRS